MKSLAFVKRSFFLVALGSPGAPHKKNCCNSKLRQQTTTKLTGASQNFVAWTFVLVCVSKRTVCFVAWIPKLRAQHKSGANIIFNIVTYSVTWLNPESTAVCHG